MTKNSFWQNLKSSLKLPLTAIAVLFLSLDQSLANGIYSQGPRRIIKYDQSGSMCHTKPIDYNPFGFSATSSDGKTNDILWEIDNPVCITFVSTVGSLLSLFSYATAVACQEPQRIAIQAASDASGVPLSPAMIKEDLKAATKCSVLMSSPLTQAQGVQCCGGIASSLFQKGVALGALGIIYGVAADAHKYARVCGTGWNVWTTDPQSGKNVFGKGNEKLPSYQYKLEERAKNGRMVQKIEEKEYREYLYGGMEYTDNGDGACSNPFWIDMSIELTPKETEDLNNYDTNRKNYDESDRKEYKILSGFVESSLTEDDQDKLANLQKRKNALADSERVRNKVDMAKTMLGYSGGKQRYYFRGPGLAPNFACERFLLASGGNNKALGLAAFECCNRRSQEVMCIESRIYANDYDEKFCVLGSQNRCQVQGVWYDVYDSKIQPNYICAKTYSVCPYNHLLGGGTEKEKINSKGEVENYCQYMKHCVKKPDKIFIRTSDLNGSYISAACRDLKGSSQNSFTYNFGILPINSRHFSAPMAQCFKETMENIFLNKAGSTKCLSPDESPSWDGKCASGYIYKEGEPALEASFFATLQEKFRFIIKLIMTIAVTVIGISILLAGKPIERKELMMFVVKLAVITYFALGDAWQSAFFNGVFNSGMVIAEIVMQPDEENYVKEKIKVQETTSSPEEQKNKMRPFDEKLDGCQFPRFNYRDLSDDKIRNFAYPPGKSYLKIWDTFDCKIASSLGYGPTVSVPNITWMILGGFVTGGAGIVFFVGAFMFAFYLIALVIRSLHIFLLSSISIVLLVWVSPLTITAVLFKKSSSVYQKWQAQMIGMVFQPVILFAYLGVLITIFNATIIGNDVKFQDDGRTGPKTIVCEGEAKYNSIYCIFKVGEIKTYNGFEPLGLTIPMLDPKNIDKKVYTIIKAALLMFVFTKILDQIPSIATALVGGAKLASNTSGALAMAGASFGAMKAIQVRAKQGAAKHLPQIIRGGIGAAKRAGRSTSLAIDTAKAIRNNEAARPIKDESIRDAGKADNGNKVDDKSGDAK